jgi:ABC-2 type transport system permease protein
VRRAWIVAASEFRAFVRTKSFVIGLVLPPALTLLGTGAAWLARPESAAAPRATAPPRVAVVDDGASLFGPLEIAAGARNAALDAVGAPGLRVDLERVDPEDARRAEALVRRGELLALVEIPGAAARAAGDAVRIRVVAQDPAGFELSRWLEETVAGELRRRAIRSAGLPAELRERLERPVAAEWVAPAPLPEEAHAAAPDPEAAAEPARSLLGRLGPYAKLAIAAPLALILVFAVAISSGPLFQGVLEEKSSRVAEILLASITPFELMLGKLLGSLAASGIVAAVYGGAVLAVMVLALGAAIPGPLLLLFAAYLVLGALLWGAVYLSIGAACADMKDAQNLMLPAVMLQILPLMFLQFVMAAPGGGMARFLSLFPPSAGPAMLLRLGADPGPPAAEVALSLALLAAAAFVGLWAASRVVRVGLLLQGRSASLREILHWVRVG